MSQKPSTKRIVVGIALSLLFAAGFTVLFNNWLAGLGMGFILGTAIEGFAPSAISKNHEKDV